MDTFLDDVSAYAEYDGTPLADLPNTDSITVQPERWALTYTDPRSPGVTTALFLPETSNFDPNVGLPGELQSSVMATVRENIPQFYDQYLSDLEVNYANSRTTIEFDDATYGPDADCPYPTRTDLGGGFSLERIPSVLCRPNARIEIPDDDPNAARTIVIISIEEVNGRIWLEITVFRDFSTY
ncbi:uncharacterized protein LOC118413351 [Branchiostoma floridae]|nr:uncharacterized protein LOC118413351 [Branchiostoma floridae]